MVVPFPAGGPTDTIGRVVAEGMRASLGPVVIDNVGGAAGSLAAPGSQRLDRADMRMFYKKAHPTGTSRERPRRSGQTDTRTKGESAFLCEKRAKCYADLPSEGVSARHPDGRTPGYRLFTSGFTNSRTD
jgi:hypothetical protein